MDIAALLSVATDEMNAFAAVASAAAAVFAVLISVVSLVVSYKTLAIQRKHNRLSVTPVAEVTVADFEDSIRVKLRNHGVGPLVLLDVHIGDGSTTTRKLIDWMPALPKSIDWTNFCGELRGRCIPAGGEIQMLRLDGDEKDTAYCRARDECRMALKMLTVNVEFTDVYGSPMKPVCKSLDWFGRHVSPP